MLLKNECCSFRCDILVIGACIYIQALCMSYIYCLYECTQSYNVMSKNYKIIPLKSLNYFLKSLNEMLNWFFSLLKQKLINETYTCILLKIEDNCECHISREATLHRKIIRYKGSLYQVTSGRCKSIYCTNSIF